MAVAFALGGLVCLIAASIVHLLMYCRISGQIDPVEVKGCKPNEKQVIIYAIAEKDAARFLQEARAAASDEHLRLLSQCKLAYLCAQKSQPTQGLASEPISPESSCDVQRAQWRLNVFPVAGFYFTRLPSEHSVAKALTRMDGSFSLWVRGNQKYLIAAETYLSKAPPRTNKSDDPSWRQRYRPPQRLCYWFVWVPVGNTAEHTLTLSLDNSSESSSPESALLAQPYEMWGQPD